MSGEAGASIEGELYRIAIGSGVSIGLAGDPGDYFARESAPFRAWLERAKPALDALFERLVAEGEPIVRFAQSFEEIWGTFVEDGEAKAFARYHRGGPLIVRLSGIRHMPELQSLNVAFLVSRRVERARMEAIVARVADAIVGVAPARRV
ncbi:MAG: hypothetical protein JNL83_37105 [Myxococcales bacterium]|nr:hypothetical protein [Myxococcales bacterium]